MPGPWDEYASDAGEAVAPDNGGPWTEFAATETAANAQAAAPEAAYRGTVLPLSKDEKGNVSFDAHAGILGAILSGFSLSGDVKAGKVKLPSSGAVPGSVPFGSPESAGERVADLAFIGNPASAATRAGIGSLGVPIRATPGQAATAAAGRIGVEIPKAAASDSMLVQRAGQAATNVPIGGTPLRAAAERATVQLGDAAARVAAKPTGGAAVGVEQAGQTARGALTNYVGPVTMARSRALYDQVDTLVDNTVKTPITNTSRAIGDILAKRGEAALPEGEVAGRLKEAVSRDGLTYQGIKKLRTDIGEDIDKGILPAGMSAAELKQVYGALSDDLAAAVGNAGGREAQAAFTRANTYHRLISARRENLMRILSAKSDEGVFAKIAQLAGSGSTADAKLLSQARKSMPADEWAEVSSAMISRLGRSNSASTSLPVSGAQPSDFSAALFVRDYAKLSDKGKNILFNSLPEGGKLRRALDDIARVSERAKTWQRFSNPSGTAQNVIGGGQLMSIGGAVVAGASGDPVTPLAVLGSIMGPAVLSRALARPATAGAIEKFSRAYERAILRPGGATFPALASATRDLSAATADTLGVKIDPDKVLEPPAGGGGF